MVSTAGVLYPYTAMSALFSMLNDERFIPQLPPPYHPDGKRISLQGYLLYFRTSKMKPKATATKNACRSIPTGV